MTEKAKPGGTPGGQVADPPAQSSSTPKEPGKTPGAENVVALDVFGTVGVALIARLLNLTTTRVHQLAAEGVIPREGRGKYPVLGAVRGYVSFLQKHHEIDPGAVDPEKLEPFRRKAHYQAEGDKLDLLEKQGTLIPRAEVEEEFARVAKIVTECLETLPDLLERDTGATPRQVALTERAIDGVRESIHARLLKPAKAARG